jgi:hypothetical protein
MRKAADKIIGLALPAILKRLLKVNLKVQAFGLISS